MELKQAPARSPRAGASLRRIEGKSIPLESGAAPHAKTQKVSKPCTVQNPIRLDYQRQLRRAQIYVESNILIFILWINSYCLSGEYRTTAQKQSA